MAPPLVEYRCISLHPTCIGNERIRLDADGRLYSAKNSRECDEGQLWSAEWLYRGRVGEEVVKSFMQQIQQCGVISLPEKIADSDAEDGKREELEVWINGKLHQCYLENASHPIFSFVVRHLYGVLAMAQME